LGPNRVLALIREAGRSEVNTVGLDTRMRIHVDPRALRPARPVACSARPDIFRFDDDGELQYLPEVNGELAARADAAASVCAPTRRPSSSTR